jgi:hypothetical protein
MIGLLEILQLQPGRAISATGTLRLTLKSSADIERDIPDLE